jgi:4-amino-4-deoxy-L-arabinose transferase-like glycosyltransferase
MGMLERVIADRRKLLAATVLVFALAAGLRFFNTQWSFSNNGVDEGIMLVRAQMLAQGYDLFTEIPCDQAPLVFLLGAFMDGDVVASRVLVAIMSVGAIAACMEASKRIKGNIAMLVTGILLSVDFVFLRESRLFSLDAMSAIFLAFAILPFIYYLRDGSRVMLATSGIFVGLAAMSKLFGAVALVGILFFMVIDALAERNRGRSTRRHVTDIALVTASAAVPVLALLVLLGPSEMLQGMIFDQGHRELDLFMKLSLPLFFGFNLAYALPLVYARALWLQSREARMLLCMSAVLLADFVLQPLVFLHHLALMSPPLAVLSGIFIAGRFELEKAESNVMSKAVGRKKSIGLTAAISAVLVVGIAISASTGLYGLASQGEAPQQAYAERIREWTTPDDWIISGDPLIAAYSERSVPLDMINMGTRIYPVLTLQDVQDAVLEFDVSVVVVCYRLFEDDMSGLPGWLTGHGYVLVPQAEMGEWSSSAIDMGENEDIPSVYVLEDIAERFDLGTL